MRRLTRFGRVPVAAAAVLLLFAPNRAGAQGTAPAPQQPPEMRKWDASGAVGWHTRRLDGGLYGYRTNSGWFGLTLGRYWTENIKTEVDAGSAGTADGFYYDESFRLPPYGPPASVHDSNVQVSAAQLYQFFHNAWVHPFVGAGVVLAREQYEAGRPATQVPVYSYANGQTTTQWVAVPAFSRAWTEWTAAPFVLTGFKGYVSHHAFVRADFRMAFGTTIATNARIGFGFDF